MDFGSKRHSIRYKLAISASQPASLRVINSPVSDLRIVRQSPKSLLKDGQLPPWKQPVHFELGSPGASINCSDFWSPQMRKRVEKTYFPSKIRSKVAPRFHSHDFDAARSKFLEKACPERGQRIAVQFPDIRRAERHWRGSDN